MVFFGAFSFPDSLVSRQYTPIPIFTAGNPVLRHGRGAGDNLPLVYFLDSHLHILFQHNKLRNSKKDLEKKDCFTDNFCRISGIPVFNEIK
jgi:hypothetical protein